MNVGMLWFDNDPKTALVGKIERAATYYRSKYGCTPTICFVHPSMLAQNTNEQRSGDVTQTDPIEVKPNRSVLPNHFWLGVNASAT